MAEFNLTGPTKKVDAVLKLIKHTITDTWERTETNYDLNVEVEEDDVDDLYEACDQAGVKITMV